MKIYNDMFNVGLSGREELKKQFEIEEKDLKGYKILYANYSLGSYDGDAFVLLEKDGELYEVNGSHCSCHGLEGQWDPESTSTESLLSMDGRYGDSYVLNDIIEVLKESGHYK